MKVYVAAGVKHASAAQAIAERIEARDNLEVMTRWYFEDFTVPSSKERDRIVARSDIRDLTMSDVLVYIDTPELSAGRNTELGYALAMGKPIFVLSECVHLSDNVFFSLSQVEHYKNCEKMIGELAKLATIYTPSKGKS